jgi:hypothetical protein
VLVRFGLVTFAVGMFFQLTVTNFPITLDTSQWWSGSSLVAMATILLVTGLGLRTALAGRTILRDELSDP